MRMFIARLLVVPSACAAAAETRLTVMTFNMWGLSMRCGPSGISGDDCILT